MQKQKKQLLVMVILLVIGILVYAGIGVYNKKQEEKQAAEEEANKITVTDMNCDDITSFSYQYEGELLEFVKEDGTWYYKADKSISIDQDVITSMLETASGLDAETAVTDYDTLSDYGLDTPSNTITMADGTNTVTLLLGNKNEMLSQYYVKREEEDTVYLVSVSLETVFGKSVGDLTEVEESTEELSATESTEE